MKKKKNQNLQTKRFPKMPKLKVNTNWRMPKLKVKSSFTCPHCSNIITYSKIPNKTHNKK